MKFAHAVIGRTLVSALLLVAAQSSAKAEALELPQDFRHVFHAATDATDIECDLYATVTAGNELTGAAYGCSNKPEEFTRYTLREIRKGVVVQSIQMSNRRPAVVTITAPDLDSVRGGRVLVRYLTNGLSGSYNQLPFQIENGGTTWISFTTVEAGRKAFNQIFLRRRTALGQVVGVKCVDLLADGGLVGGDCKLAAQDADFSDSF